MLPLFTISGCGYVTHVVFFNISPNFYCTLLEVHKSRNTQKFTHRPLVAKLLNFAATAIVQEIFDMDINLQNTPVSYHIIFAYQ